MPLLHNDEFSFYSTKTILHTAVIYIIVILAYDMKYERQAVCYFNTCSDTKNRST